MCGGMCGLTRMLTCVVGWMRECGGLYVCLRWRVCVLPWCGELTPQSLQEDGWTPLLISAQDGHKEVVAALLDRGADVDKATVRVCGWLPLPPSLYCPSVPLCLCALARALVCCFWCVCLRVWVRVWECVGVCLCMLVFAEDCASPPSLGI